MEQERDGVAAVIFDWAGTVIDFGSHAPMGAFVELFARHGVAITIEEARIPMGLPKWDHIKALASMPRIAAAWRSAHGAPLHDAGIDALYAEFTPMNTAAVASHAELIPGVRETIAALRGRGVRIGSTTGYNRPIMDVMAPLAAAQGFEPDNMVCAGDLASNRPTPLAIYRCMLDLDVWPAHRVVKVDDTLPGLWEGRHAGCWTVAVTASGNEMGLTLGQWRELDADERAVRVFKVERRLQQAQPDFLIETVADLVPVLGVIEERLRNGGRPRPA